MTTARSSRAPFVANEHLIVAGHPLAAAAGFSVLQAGGNAIDAGVAAGIALNVLESHVCGFAGVAPMMLYLADPRAVVTIDGLGRWPRAASCALFEQRFGGAIPKGILQTVVPAAADAWITALQRFGTMSFGDVAAPAVRLATGGFAVYPELSHTISERIADFSCTDYTASLFLRDGRPPRPGERFVLSDLGRTLQYLVDEEKAAAGRGRAAALGAARDAFYRGDVARTLVRFQKDNGGLLDEADLRDFNVRIEEPVTLRFGATTLYSCGPWCQGPMLLEALGLAQHHDLRGLGHNSAAYLHVLTEAIKLAAADREAYFGDPQFVDVPVGELLSPSYLARRVEALDMRRAWPDLPPAGKVGGVEPASPRRPLAARSGALDTSYVCVVDRHGNVFSATPSDGAVRESPFVPGTGLVASPRGSQSWGRSDHPSCVAPGKRPRLTPNPALAIDDDGAITVFGTPGGDHQTQAMLQALLNLKIFGMSPQNAVEAPRVMSQGFPDSFEPHGYTPGLLSVEAGIPGPVFDGLGALGHRVERWPDWQWPRTSVCMIVADPRTGLRSGGADFRRSAYAMGW